MGDSIMATHWVDNVRTVDWLCDDNGQVLYAVEQHSKMAGLWSVYDMRTKLWGASQPVGTFTTREAAKTAVDKLIACLGTRQ